MTIIIASGLSVLQLIVSDTLIFEHDNEHFLTFDFTKKILVRGGFGVAIKKVSATVNSQAFVVVCLITRVALRINLSSSDY